jgi:hypothetical protein
MFTEILNIYKVTFPNIHNVCDKGFEGTIYAQGGVRYNYLALIAMFVCQHALFLVVKLKQAYVT